MIFIIIIRNNNIIITIKITIKKFQCYIKYKIIKIVVVIVVAAAVIYSSLRSYSITNRQRII